MIKTIRVAACLCALLIFAGRVSAALPYYDSFSYTTGDTLGTRTGTNSTSGNWVTYSNNTPPPIGNQSLSYPTTPAGPTPTGFDVKYDNSSTTGNGSGYHALGQSISSGTVYYSLLLDVTAIGTNGFTSGSNLTAGSFLAGFSTDTNPTGQPNPAGNGVSCAAPLVMRSGDGSASSANYQLGTGVNQFANTTISNRRFEGAQGPSAGHATNTTLFLVFSFTYRLDVANPNGPNSGDYVKMWINPTPGTLEADNNSAKVIDTGPSGTNDTGIYLNGGVNSGTASDPAIVGFIIRTNSVGADAMEVDELRIGTNWEDVTPPAPEPAAALAIIASGGLFLRRSGRPRHDPLSAC